MHLFVLYLHPLVCRLEQACGSDLLVGYADDISVIVTSPEKIDAIHALFTRFEAVAGAKLNLRKTVAIDVGYCEENRFDVQWLQTVDTVKILGVIFANSIRLMTTLNWNAAVGKFSQLMWLQSSRTLTLLQKVTVLNTFGTSRIWYLSSILPPLGVHIAKITSRMGTFLWSGLVARVPIMQLARNREHGGLRLQLPMLKCKSLAIHRHLREIDSLPFYRSLLFPDNPRPTISIDLPDVKLILSNLSHIPLPIQQNPSADQIHQYFVQQTEVPKVERNSPACDWPRTWRNIATKQLSSMHRSQYYILVNGKTIHQKLLFVMHRAPDENCTHCGNQLTETLLHKFATCTRVEPAWMVLQQRIIRIMNGWRRLSFEDLVRPALAGIDRRRRNEVLNVFIKYICFVCDCNNVIDVDALKFHLDL